MKPRYNWSENNVLARCPDCDAVTSFDTKGFSSTSMGTAIVNVPQTHEGRNYTRILWSAFRCSVCSRGAIAKILDSGNSQTAILVDFIPRAMEKAALPPSVPSEIVKEFRESELDATHAAYRSASAMLRSVLEKTLKLNGYDEVEVMDKQNTPLLDKNNNPRKSTKLIDRIDAAARDSLITETRQKRAHENIRDLGNDILHDDWHEVTQEEFEGAHKYSQRILEDFYDDRPTVLARLTAKGRPFVK